MARSTGLLNARSALTLGVVILVLTSLLPSGLTRWAGAFNRPLTFLLAPVQMPVRTLVVTLSGADDAPDWNDRQLAELAEQKSQLDLALRQARREIEDLRQQIREITLGMNVAPDFVPRLIGPVGVIGAGGDSGGLVTIKAGAREGVEPGAMVVLRGVHLVGRVQRVDSRTAAVISITDPSQKQPVGAVVMLDDQSPGPMCLLLPDGRGGLRGRLEDSGDPNAPAREVRPGMLVRLQDPQWPLSAHMLVLGRVELVEPMPEQSLRRLVVVKPEYRLDRARDVTVRMDGDRGAPVGGAEAPR